MMMMKMMMIMMKAHIILDTCPGKEGEQACVVIEVRVCVICETKIIIMITLLRILTTMLLQH